MILMVLEFLVKMDALGKECISLLFESERLGNHNGLKTPFTANLQPN